MGKNRNFNNNNRNLSTSRDMEREAIHVLKDIAYGRATQKDLNLFANPQFLQAGIKAVTDNMEEAGIIMNAMMVAYPGNTEERILRIYNYYKRKYETYAMIRNQLCYIAQTGFLGYLVPLQNNLPKCKGNM